MGGPFMVEIVFCRVTRRGRKKKAGMNKLARENCRNDGPMGGGFVPPDTLKITLDLSDSGPVFSALDDMMMKMMEDDEKARAGNKGDNSAAKAALKKLLKSGIPGIEAMFGGEEPKPRFGKGGGKKGYHKLTDASKKKFMAAIFGEEGAQIDSSTAAALLAATCSMGNPDVGNKLAELLMPELDEKVDPAMMAALMSACSMIQTGASTEEVLNIMKLELAASGLTEEEILVKAQLLMKAFGKEGDTTAEYMLMSKQMNGALNQAGLPPKDFTAVRCSLEDVADNMISSLCARGEKTARIIGQVCETLKKTGATAHVVASTMMPPLAEMTGECETSLIRVIGRNLKEVEYDVEEVKSAVTELVLKILDNDPPQYHDAVKALEDTLKELGMFSNDIQVYIKENIPSPPTPPEEIARRAAVAAEMARLEAEEEERARMKALKAADPKAYEKEMRLMMAELKESDPEAYAAEMKKNPEFSRLSSLQNEAMGSRRGSGVPGLGTSRSRAGSIVIGTGSRRGSYFEDGTTKRATVAMVTDDPDHKAAMREGLAGAFGDDDGETNGYDEEENEGPSGSLPPGTSVETSADGRVRLEGAELPKGATVTTNSDGSVSISGNLDVGAKVERNADGSYSVNGAKLPSAVTVIKNADGSMSIVSTSAPDPFANTKLPKTAVTNADGSTSLPAGTVVKENADGSVTVDGVSLPQGTTLKKMPDGSTVLISSPLANTKLPKTAKTNSDGSVTLAPGTSVKENPDGSITVDGVKLPKGTGIKKMPDGSTVVFKMPKLRKVGAAPPQVKTNPDGSVSLGSVKLPAGAGAGPDGAISLPKGTNVTRAADGTVCVDGAPLPPGIGAKVNPDGSISLAPTNTLPPPPKVKTGPDGSLAVGNTKLPKGSKPNLDGSIGLPAGAKVSKGKDGSVTIDGQKLPPGTTIQTNADGSMSVVSSLPPPTGIQTSPDGTIKMGDVSLPKGATAAFDGTITLAKGADVSKGENGRLTVGGQELPIGTKVRTNPDGSMSIVPPSPALMMDSEMAEKLLAAGMEEKYIRELLSGGGKGISPESRALMEQILASSGSQEELASRVTALLEGTALSGNRGEDTFVGDDGTNLSEARSGNMSKLEEDSLRRPGETVSLAEKIRMRNAAKGARGSVKRQSEIQREKKKSRQEEREEERQRKASYYRKVTGLRRAKVPMMVYSCGGFSRCFRVCRFYDVEGPPVGVEYEPAAALDTRRELNPDL